MLGLERRLPQLANDIAALESENDEQMYATVSLQLINNELSEIQWLVDKLNSSSSSSQRLSTSVTQQVQDLACLNILLLRRQRALSNWRCVHQLEALRGEMEQLQAYDSMQVVKRQQDNRRLTRDLQQCRTGHQHLVQPTRRPRGASPNTIR